MNKSAQRVCAHGALIYMALVGIGIFVLPGWLPPPSPDIPAEVVSATFQDNILLRIGMVFVISGALFMVSLPAVISVQMRRIEGPNHVYADIQFAVVVVAAITVLFAGMFWSIIAWRPDVDSDVIVAFNDLSWFLIVSDGPPVALQALVVGLCILGGGQQRIYPRWIGYFNLWVAALTVPGMASFFFKTGPMAWDGLIAFWIPVPLYFAWYIVMYIYTLKAISAQSE